MKACSPHLCQSKLVDPDHQYILKADKPLGGSNTAMGESAWITVIMAGQSTLTQPLDLAGVTAKEYHSDNGIFVADDHHADCADKSQSQTLSGVGAQHQNAIAERAIEAISYWAQTMMVHASIHWPSDGADEIRLWAFAIKHTVWLYNRLPNAQSGLTPLEIFTKTKSDHRDLHQSHVWGCPVYVLDPTLQAGKKIPKWNCWSRLGQFLGFSDEHSSLVGRVQICRQTTSVRSIIWFMMISFKQFSILHLLKTPPLLQSLMISLNMQKTGMERRNLMEKGKLFIVLHL
ncbi:hypothetical protein ACHAXS_000213 [Conticribra weissflogii]